MAVLVKRSFLVLTVVTIVLIHVQGAPTDDVTAGLDCTKGKDGKVIACTGKSPTFTDSEKKINTYIKNNNADFQTKMTGLTTRFGGPGGGSPGRPGGPAQPGTPQYCDAGGCPTSVNQIYTPSLLYNTHGDPRFVLQMPAFSQYVFLTVCESENGVCGHQSTCEQKQFPFTLLVWDPFYPESGLYVESFDVPSGCCCSGSKGGSIGSIYAHN